MSLHIVKTNNLYYGSGMAFNYFYGYLRLVLPDPEVGTTSVKGTVLCLCAECKCLICFLWYAYQV